jgi:hypothetical protein
MYKLLFILFVMFLVCGAAGAKVPVKKTIPFVRVQIIPRLQVDTGQVNVRKFNGAALTRYNTNPDFDYQVVTTKRDFTWWNRFWSWVWELLAKLFGHPDASPSAASQPSPLIFIIIRYLFYAGAIALFIYIVIKFMGLDFGNLFNRDSKQVPIPYTESLENIHLVTFDEEIEKALGQRNYKLAIRLLYLSTLKQLNDARLIQWQLEKTNTAYLNELADSGQRQSFGILTRQFEYVWYGNFSVDARSFQHINTLFLDFKKMLP